MPFVLCLLSYCAVAVFGAPWVLTAGTWQVRRPRLAMALWHGFFASGLCAAGLSLVWSVGAAAGANGASPQSAGWLLPMVVVIGGWLSLGVVGALCALVLQRAETMVVVDRHEYGHVATLLDLATYRTSRVGRTSVAFIDVDAPLAFAAPGMDMVVVSSRVEQILDPGEMRALIEHERTHLIQHHGLIKRLARLNSACLPGVRVAGKFEHATRMLVELIADDRAARVCGPHAVSSALVKLAGLRSNESMRLRAERIQRRGGTNAHPSAFVASGAGMRNAPVRGAD